MSESGSVAREGQVGETEAPGRVRFIGRYQRGRILQHAVDSSAHFGRLACIALQGVDARLACKRRAVVGPQRNGETR